jgi:hypothetical protein
MSSKQEKWSRYWTALGDPALNDYAWTFIHQNREAVERIVAASPRLQAALAGKTAEQLYAEGGLGAVFGDATLHAADHPAEYGFTSRDEALQAFGADRNVYVAYSTLRDEHMQTRATEKLAEEVAARLGKRDEPGAHEEETLADHEDAEGRAHASAAYERASRDKAGRSRDTDYARALRQVARKYAAGLITAEQYQQIEADILASPGAQTVLDRESINEALRGGAISYEQARQFANTVDLQALQRGELRPFVGGKREWKTAAAYWAEEERAAAERGELPPAREFYLASEEDGISIAGLPDEQARALEHFIPSAGMPQFTIEERRAFKGNRREATRLAVAENMWKGGKDGIEADVGLALERDAEEREARNERFANGEATSRDYAARAWDEQVGTGREALLHEADVSLQKDIDHLTDEARSRTFDSSRSTPAPEPEPAPSTPSSGSRAAAEAAYDAVIHNQ